MNKMRVSAPQLAPFVAELGIKWDVSFWHVPSSEAWGNFPVRIECIPREKAHEIAVNDGVMRSPAWFIADLVGALCRASLAERVDPCFATSRFGPASRRLDTQDPEKFRVLYNRFFLIHAHADVWVGDVMHSHWPEISRQDSESLVGSAIGLAQDGQWEMIQSPTSLLGLGLNLGEIRRHDLDVADISPALRGLGRAQRAFVFRFADFCRNLPRLSYNREQDLRLLERTVSESARLQGLSLQPRLIEDPEQRQAVWEVV